MAAIGVTAIHIRSGIGVADLKTTCSHLSELHVGDLVAVLGTVGKFGTKSLTAHYWMVDIGTGTIAAEMEVVSVQFDLRARKAIQVALDIRSKVEQF